MTDPLWLPRGSIRALLALSVAITTLYMVLVTREQIPQSLGNVLIVSVAFYYSTRSSISPPSETTKKTEINEPPPLFMPNYTVRVSLAIIIALSIVVTALYNQEIPIFMLTVLLTIIGYGLGMVIKKIVTIIFPPKPGRNKAKELIGHLQAGAILTVVIGVCIGNILSTLNLLPLDFSTLIFINQLLELAIGYYFGSRTIR
ncbi:MAG: hypothetical protein ACXAC8_15185 [Candidatus Hodarchaeales archaeon]